MSENQSAVAGGRPADSAAPGAPVDEVRSRQLEAKQQAITSRAAVPPLDVTTRLDDLDGSIWKPGIS
jgi:hypothetical protein